MDEVDPIQQHKACVLHFLGEHRPRRKGELVDSG